ncbi:charged multivesicular body protein 1b isoform 1-T1 [Amazona ochrocephala]
MEVARIHAENAIRQKNQAINFLRMSARVDAVAARVQTAVTMGKVTKSMAGVVKSMDATLKSMNLEKISALMDKFEHQFETLDVQTQQMEDTMSNTTTLTTPQNQVDMLLQEMADEAGLDLNMELPQGQTGSVGTSVASAEQVQIFSPPSAVGVQSCLLQPEDPYISFSSSALYIRGEGRCEALDLELVLNSQVFRIPWNSQCWGSI